jgi:carboxylesterase type B
VRHHVSTEAGTVAGLPGRDPGIRVFRGIPYAAPPIGPLRFRPPQPVAGWSGVRRAERPGPICPQPPSDEADLSLPMSEDCLNLNVWAPQDPAPGGRPVLVWIHGGGFRVGGAATARLDAENLARRGLVVVTFNYRLGAFGFLATPELSAESAADGGIWASGNAGLLDAVAVLRWVQANIRGFGGDRDRVTVAGQSAGAGLVNFLALSPVAKGLFHRAVAQSHARYARDPELRYLSTSYRRLADAEQAGTRYARERGARSLAALRDLPWHRLVDGDNARDTGVRTGSRARPPLFRPVLDGHVVPEGYERTYAAGRQNDVAFLAGNNLDEAGAVPESMFSVYRAAIRATARTNARTNVRTTVRAGGKAAASDSARLARSAAAGLWRPGSPPVNVTLVDYRDAAAQKFAAMAPEFLRLYPATTDDEAAGAYNAAVQDNSRISTFRWAQDWSRHGSGPVFTYFWTHASPAQDPPRASHSSEIEYVFANVDVEGPVPAAWTAADRRIAEVMSGYWVNFTTSGDPNGPGLPHWPPFSPAGASVMELGDHFGLVPIAAPDRLDFWERFFGTQTAW